MRALLISETGYANATLARVVRDGARSWYQISANAPSDVHALTAHALRVQPRRILRQRLGEKVVVRGVPVAWPDPAWHQAWADAVTFCGQAANRYMARPIAVDESQLRNGQAGLAPLTPGDIACPCGWSYDVTERHCSRCGGADPLRAVVRDVHELELRIAAEVSVVAGEPLLRALGEFRSLIETHRVRLEREPPNIEGMLSKSAAAATLDDLRERLDIGGLTRERLKSLRADVGKAPQDIGAGLLRHAMAIRQRWTADTRPLAVADVVASARAEIEHYWRQVTTQVRVVLDARGLAVAHFAPVHGTLKKTIDTPDWQSALRFGWTALTAIKTLGMSLVLKGALWLFKEGRSARALETFDKSLGSFREELVRTESVLTGIEHEERARGSARARNMARLLVRTLEIDYAAAPPDGQLEIAQSVALLLGTRPPAADDRRPRLGLFLRRYRVVLTLIALVCLAAVLHRLWQ